MPSAGQIQSSLRHQPTDSESFYSGALTRISRFMISLAVIFTAGALLTLGWRIGLGFVCGCAVAYLNFHWLKRVVTALSERATQEAKARSSKGVVLRFLFRYFLMGAVAYAIFSISPASLYGLFAGLFLPVAAIACEAAYEAYVAVVRGL